MSSSHPPFSIRVLPPGRTLQAEVTQTLLDAILAAGIRAPHSCTLGYCGSCRARLVSGVIVYPSGQVVDSASDATPPDQIMLCIARARSDVELELCFPPHAG